MVLQTQYEVNIKFLLGLLTIVMAIYPFTSTLSPGAQQAIMSLAKKINQRLNVAIENETIWASQSAIINMLQTRVLKQPMFVFVLQVRKYRIKVLVDPVPREVSTCFLVYRQTPSRILPECTAKRKALVFFPARSLIPFMGAPSLQTNCLPKALFQICYVRDLTSIYEIFSSNTGRRSVISNINHQHF